MDKNMQRYYEQELRFVRELGAEFARKFPKVAGRLGIRELSNEDPHVERLFQGFALLAGRVQQRLEDEFPAFTETLLDQLYGNLFKPTPSIVVVQFQPTATDPSLASGPTIPRGTELRARTTLASGSSCEYRTAHPVELWPIEIESLEYTSVLHRIADLRVPARDPIRALLRIGLRATCGLNFSELQLKSLPIYVNGTDETSGRLYEALIAHVGLLVLRWGPRPAEHVAFGAEFPATRQLGFASEEALLPTVASSFRAYRLLHEYFALPTRFNFVELQGLGPGISRCSSDRLELILPLKHHEPALEGKLELSRLQLFATPAVNLLSKRCDAVQVDRSAQEFAVIPDRGLPLDYEVHSVTRVAAHVSADDAQQEILPLCAVRSRLERAHSGPHYQLERRSGATAQPALSGRSSTGYTGSAVFLRLIDDPHTERARVATRRLSIDALCTNRDLPLLLSRDRNRYFTIGIGAPIDAVRCLAGPSAPRSQLIDGDSAWRWISHMSQSYLNLNDETGGGEALRELLGLYAAFADPQLRREIEGIRSVRTKPVVGTFPQPGPQTFARGLEVRLVCEERAFTQGALALTAVLSVLFARQVTAHSFTQTIFHSVERGDVHHLSSVPGVKHAL